MWTARDGAIHIRDERWATPRAQPSTWAISAEHIASASADEVTVNRITSRGRLIGLSGTTRAGGFLCVADISVVESTRCRSAGAERLAWISTSLDTLTTSSEDALRSFDAHTLALRAQVLGRTDARDTSRFRRARQGRELKIFDLDDLTPLRWFAEDGVESVRFVSEEGVLRDIGTELEARTLSGELIGLWSLTGSSGDEWVLWRSGAVSWSPDMGFERFHRSPRRRFGPISPSLEFFGSDDSLYVEDENGAYALRLDDRGILPDLPRLIRETDVLRRFRHIAAGRDASVRLVAVNRIGAPREVAAAYLEGGQLWVVGADDNAREVVAVPGMPRRLDRCRAGFIADYELMVRCEINGDAPLRIRIDIRNRRADESDDYSYSAPVRSPYSLVWSGDHVIFVDRSTGSRQRVASTYPITSAEMSADGSRVYVNHGTGFSVYVVDDFVRSGRSSGARSFHQRWGAPDFPTYMRDEDVLVRCREGRVVLTRPFDADIATDRRLPRCREPFTGASSVSFDGFIGITHRDGDCLTIVRLRDGATLDACFVSSPDSLAVMLTDGERVLGFYPPNTELFRIRTEASDGSVRLVRPSGSPETAQTVVRRFFERAP